tara:strand:+ start:9698 stop:10531 length:834 start_codon:yes stop_codon:yes gene_type:complete
MVDIILCTYNSENTIQECINSILNQSYKDFNLYIFDDKSTDKTVKLIKDFNDKRIKLVISSKNVGTYAGKNFILKNLCKSKYVALHDSDDISLPNRLEYQLNYMILNKIKCTGTAVYEIFEDHIPHTLSEHNILNNERINIYPPKIDKEILPKVINTLQEKYSDYLSLKFCMNGTCMFEKSLLNELGGWDGNTRIAADTDIFLRILGNYEIHNLKTPLYKRRFHKTSLTAAKEYGIKSDIRKEYNLKRLDVAIQSFKGCPPVRDFYYPKSNYTLCVE